MNCAALLVGGGGRGALRCGGQRCESVVRSTFSIHIGATAVPVACIQYPAPPCPAKYLVRVLPVSLPCLRSPACRTGTRSRLHVDILETHFWMMQVEGRKEWVIFNKVKLAYPRPIFIPTLIPIPSLLSPLPMSRPGRPRTRLRRQISS